jgi:hypothetical protein
VVVFKDPGHYVPILYNVKRVLAVGGQHVRVYPSDTIANRHYRLEVRSVPPYFLHVEGARDTRLAGKGSGKTSSREAKRLFLMTVPPSR